MNPEHQEPPQSHNEKQETHFSDDFEYILRSIKSSFLTSTASLNCLKLCVQHNAEVVLAQVQVVIALVPKDSVRLMWKFQFCE
jgi:hypothetical protein